MANELLGTENFPIEVENDRKISVICFTPVNTKAAR